MMPLGEEILDYEEVQTDAQAHSLLPPHRAAHATYAARRAEGHDCRTALRITLKAWREYWESARPAAGRPHDRT
jgi:hypothetical protein